MAPKPTFQAWVRAFGIGEVAALCGVTRRSVYFWLSGHVHPPHTACITILKRAKHLRYDDIVGGAQ